MGPITSLSNPRVKGAIRLRQRREREELGLMLIDGAREIRRALAAGIRVRELYLLLDDPVAAELRSLAPVETQCIEVSTAVMEKLAYGDRWEGGVAVAEIPQRSLAQVALGEQALVAVLESVEKPGNLGAVLRSADAAGISAVIVCDRQTDVYNPNSIRASLGAVFSVPVFQSTSHETLAWLVAEGFQILAARVDGAVNYTDCQMAARCALVLGSEAHGLTDQWNGPQVQPIRLPMLGQIDSLNVSVTAAVLFYEALRQRGKTA